MTIPLYPEIVREKNLAPDHFGSDIDEICEQIRDATKVKYKQKASEDSHVCFRDGERTSKR